MGGLSRSSLILVQEPLHLRRLPYETFSQLVLLLELGLCLIDEVCKSRNVPPIFRSDESLLKGIVCEHRLIRLIWSELT